MDLRLDHGAWVVVADGEKYILLRNAGDRGIANLQIFDDKAQDNPPNREQAADKPGRFDDAGVGRSAVQETDWKKLNKERFAAELAERLNKAALANRYKSLAIVADPQTLGSLRSELHEETARRVVAEVDKNLTNHAPQDIERLLTE